MRVTLNLSHFLHDHRSLAKIFVSKSMKCIKDVEDHISSIFKIHAFYLKCDNQYLPPSEDVQILQCDDIIWAVPIVPGVPTVIEDEIVAIPKKKKKKKKDAPSVEEFVDETVHKKEKKKRKHDSVKTKTEEAVEVDEIPIKLKKKNKCPLINGDAFHQNITKCRKLKSPDSGHGSANGDSGEKNSPVRHLINNFESKSSTGSFSELKGPEKRTNIVKTIIISNGSHKTEDSKCVEIEGSKCAEIEDSKRVETEDFKCVEIEDSANIEIEQKESNWDADFPGADILSSSMDTSTVTCSSLNDAEVNVNKRKRKRTRKRKVRQDVNTTFQQPVYNFIYKPLHVQAPNHLHFNDPENECVEATENNEIELSNNDVEDAVAIENVEKREDRKTEPTIGDGIVNLETSSYDNKDLEECILKQPITRNTEPKVDDVIAFKILRMSEIYTPEVSSTIIGKVVNYSLDTKEIDFHILRGHEQCSLPTGKFSLNPEEAPEEISKLRCSWPSLIEPRLLYP